MLGKIVVSGVSLILVVGVIIGVVATVNRHSGPTSVAIESLNPHMKAVTQLCQPTVFKDECASTLSSVNSTDPKELIKASILAISGALTKSLNFTQDIVVKAENGTRTHIALSDCQEMLQEAVQELQGTITQVGDADLHTMTDRADDFRTWLSSIIAYTEMCYDGFEENDPVRNQISNSTDPISHLTDNVLNILGGISDVLKGFGLKFNIGADSRRLLQISDGSTPTWMSATDRKLLAAGTANVKPNAVVAQDGTGQFKTIGAAIAAYPKGFKGRYIIYVKAGIYREYIAITKEQPNILLYGDGPRKTIITGNRSFAKSGLGTWKTATVIVEAPGFIAKSIGMQNTAGPDGHQAVALRVNSDMSAFFNVRLDGYQDTLCYQAGRQFYRNCVISGTIDFLFGYGTVVIQNSLLIVRMPNPNQFNTVTADGKKEKGQPGGLVIHNCRIVPEQKLVPNRMKIQSYLGRPWKQYATTVIMESQIGDFIQPQGWKEWTGDLFLDTIFYAEYGNKGPGANTNGRVKWKSVHFLNRNDALRFTPNTFLQAGQWVPAAGVPAMLSLRA